MTRRFGGFLMTEEPSLAMPRAFIAEVLPQLSDLAEVKVTLCLFDLLAETSGYETPVAEEVIFRHGPLREGLKRLGSPKEPDESIARGLELAVSRGTFLRFVAEHADGRQSAWYLLNTPRGRELLGRMARGVAPPPAPIHAGVDAPPLIVPERPNVFRLYEQNVGLLTPIIADQLIEATERYPSDWIEEAFGEAVSYNKRNWRYIRAILDKWATEGRGTGDAEHRGRAQGAGTFDPTGYRPWRPAHG
ncbi:MAG: DnaD domain protein [Chloroflexota bacterium]|nr:DnaD domain protein [Chloroflexota bacterium]